MISNGVDQPGARQGRPSSARRRGRCGPAAGSRSPTSSASASCIERTRAQRGAVGGVHRRRGPARDYLDAIEAAGLRVQTVRANVAYRFVSPRAREAAERYGVTSVSVLAIKP